MFSAETTSHKFCLMKQVLHIISLEPISERPTGKSFHEPSVQLVRIDVIGTFWRATTRELYEKTWIVKLVFVSHRDKSECRLRGNASPKWNSPLSSSHCLQTVKARKSRFFVSTMTQWYQCCKSGNMIRPYLLPSVCNFSWDYLCANLCVCACVCPFRPQHLST